MRNTSLARLASVALAALAAACTTEGTARERTNVLTVTASEFAFDAPASVPAGPTRVHLVNQGAELHHVQLVRIAEGHTFQELVEASKAGGPPPSWITFVGGPNTPVPGGESDATLNLRPGSYALVCLIPSKDGVPHLMKGMVKPLTVTGSPVDGGRAEAGDVRVRLTDYSYEMDREITAGRRTLHIENTAAQPHEFILVRLAPGKSAQDMMAWLLRENGPPPGAPMGGTTVLSRGESNRVTVEMEPGEYALLCMVPDARDGKPHVMHGMVRQVTVR
jgi:plastocyanin